jgi:hypothetical protein
MRAFYDAAKPTIHKRGPDFMMLRNLSDADEIQQGGSPLTR